MWDGEDMALEGRPGTPSASGQNREDCSYIVEKEANDVVYDRTSYYLIKVFRHGGGD